jgi:hypothetical protein
MRIKSGGGITSNKYVTSRGGQKVEPKIHRGNVAGVAQQGMATAFRKEPITEGKGYEPKPMGSTGIANARQGHAGPGPGGGGRTIYLSGSQMQHGPVAKGETNKAPDVPATSTKGAVDILSQYGPERRR